MMSSRPLAAQVQSNSSFASLAARADGARDSDRLDDALVLYGKALAANPAWVEGWWSLATIQYDQDKYAEAAQGFERVIAAAPRDKTGTARVMLGLCEFQLGQDEKALKHLQEGEAIGILNDPQLREVMRYHEGTLLQRMGRFGSAQDVLESLCRQEGQNTELKPVLGMAALRMRDRTPPRPGTRAASVVQRAGEAQCLGAQNQFENARKTYDEVVAQNPDFPNLHYAYGKLLLQIHDTKAAVGEFEQEIEKRPRDVLSRLEIAAVKYRVDSAAGVPYAEQAVRLAPQLPFGHYLLGLLLVDTGKYRQAVPQLEMARRAFTSEASVYFALGTAYARTGRKQQAAEARATFLRLRRQGASKPTPNVYGEQHSGLPGEGLAAGRQIRPPD